MITRPGAPTRVRSVPSRGRNACVTAIGATVLTSSWRRRSAAGRVATGSTPACMPALLTRANKVRPLRASSTVATPFLTASVSVTSKISAVKRAGPSSSARGAASHAARTEPKTWHPLDASSRAMAAPMPLDTPVTTAARSRPARAVGARSQEVSSAGAATRSEGKGGRSAARDVRLWAHSVPSFCLTLHAVGHSCWSLEEGGGARHAGGLSAARSLPRSTRQ